MFVKLSVSQPQKPSVFVCPKNALHFLTKAKSIVLIALKIKDF